MTNPSPHTPNHDHLDRIWGGKPHRPSPTDPRHNDLIHDVDHAWDLPIPYGLTNGPTGLQPRIEFTAGPVHPSMRITLSDHMLAKAVHTFAVLENEPCGCGGCSCSTCRPRNEGGPR